MGTVIRMGMATATDGTVTDIAMGTMGIVLGEFAR